MLALLILGKDLVIGVNFDVYLQLLVEKLQQLWKGVPAYDILKPLGSKSFIMRGVFLWTIHDFPSYGIGVGVAH
jgi:hypothetical protein